MNWSIFFVVIIICIILLIICYILHNKVERQDKRCINCRKKQYEDMMDIRCKNKKSKHCGTIVDDYAVCDRWRG